MIPGEVKLAEGIIEANQGLKTETLVVENAGDRPIQVGSHFHFFEVNRYLIFARALAWGMRLNIPSGTAVRFEPGESRKVNLVQFSGKGPWLGANNLSSGCMDKSACIERAREQGFSQIGI
ncbi:urease subunit beta [Desulfosporosinus acididurans]|uniref:Urease subunit beta n=1 Tax=Desulfosporosinus acididurans TaxID=476652 RepID=A0A0J1IMM0_9FIRM|nr:urease subunit beta [Desulfosporosinus acididurans]KLU65936.1 urease subunit beta [Desulfosporosinus acididurans]